MVGAAAMAVAVAVVAVAVVAVTVGLWRLLFQHHLRNLAVWWRLAQILCATLRREESAQYQYYTHSSSSNINSLVALL